MSGFASPPPPYMPPAGTFANGMNGTVVGGGNILSANAYLGQGPMSKQQEVMMPIQAAHVVQIQSYNLGQG
jgi:hypothetical protein